MAEVDDRRFSAMGTTVHIRTVGARPELASQARDQLAYLEDRWSRFRCDSDVSALNRHAGSWVPISPETRTLLDHAVAAAAATGGRFDPTVGAALISHGYDRTFAQVAGPARTLRPRPVVDGCWPAIEIEADRARLPVGTVFDAGGIGKGLAADLVATELADQASGILINIGGDIRACGAASHAAGWVVSVDDPFRDDHELTRLAIPQGAVATSSKLARRWETGGGPAHHIIDPRTGRPATTYVAAVTVIAEQTWWAEAQATSLFITGPDGIDDLTASTEALMILDDGTVVTTPGLAGVVA